VPAFAALDQQYLDLFSGLHEIYGGDQKYTLAIERVFSESSKAEQRKILHACLILYLKPKDVMLLGKTKNGQITPIAAQLSRYLPKHTEMPIGRTDIETNEISSTRSRYPQWAQLLNFTQIRVIALLGLEACAKGQGKSGFSMFSEAHAKWIMHNHSIAHVVANIHDASTNETSRIKLEQFNSFLGDRGFWGQHLDRLVQIGLP
jgi:hypothetical protein